MKEWEKVHQIVKGFDTAMFVTQAANGRIHARPMAIADLPDDGDIWFITGDHTGKVYEIQEHQEVNLVFHDNRKTSLSVSGTAQLVRDQAHVNRIWKDTFRTWFPQGKEDPSICLIRVKPAEAEFWDNSGGRGVKYILNAAMAYAKGDQPKVESPEQHARAH